MNLQAEEAERIAGDFGRLARFAFQRLDCYEDAQDAAQETIIAGWRRYSSFGHRCELTSWLHGILRHKIADMRRRRIWDERNLGALVTERGLATVLEEEPSATFEMQPPPEYGERLDGEIEQGELGRELAQALAQLPAHYREALALHYLDGLTVEETAARMGRTFGSVESMLTRALRKARQLMEV